jgi:hypothetical protein
MCNDYTLTPTIADDDPQWEPEPDEGSALRSIEFAESLQWR